MSDRTLTISDLSGGRNGVDAPGSPDFPANQCKEAVDVDLSLPGVARRRNGSLSLMGDTTGEAFTNPIVKMIRHVPGGDENASQVWAFDESATPVVQYLAAGTGAWSAAIGTVIAPASAAEVRRISGVSFNGKLFLGYDNTGTTDRMKVYDPVTGKIRYTGMATPAAPTVANTGAGAYAATLRYYRVRFFRSNVTGVIERMSEPSTSVAFTPSGAGTAARITKPASLGGSEDENSWLVEASPDNTNWYIVAAVSTATTTYDDSAAVSSYANGALSWLSGWFTQIPSARYVLTDGQRLIFLNYIEQGLGSRVGWTPVLGTGDADDERIFQTSQVRPYISLGEKNGGDLTGGGVINGVVFAFKMSQIWRGSPTEDVYRPYVWRRVSGTVGSVSHDSIQLGEDAFGNPALYFMSLQGPYRVTLAGDVEYLGRDIEDLTRSFSGIPDLRTDAEVIAHAVFHAARGQYWLWLTRPANRVSAPQSPNTLCVLTVRNAARRDQYGIRGGWAVYTLGDAYCSCLGHSVVGASSGLTVPWYAVPDTNSSARVCDQESSATDASATIQSYVLTKSLAPLGQRLRVGEIVMVAEHVSTSDITLKLTPYLNYEAELSSPTVTVPGTTLTGIPRTSVVKFQSSIGVDAAVLQLRIGDVSGGADNAWRIHQIYVPVYLEGEL